MIFSTSFKKLKRNNNFSLLKTIIFYLEVLKMILNKKEDCLNRTLSEEVRNLKEAYSLNQYLRDLLECAKNKKIKLKKTTRNRNYNKLPPKHNTALLDLELCQLGKIAQVVTSINFQYLKNKYMNSKKRTKTRKIINPLTTNLSQICAKLLKVMCLIKKAISFVLIALMQATKMI